MTKRAALLCRVSSVNQARDDRFGIPTQLEHGRRYAKQAGFALGGEYIDQISGVSETREAFYRLLAEAEKYDVTIIYDTSRLGRSEELSHRFLRLLREAGLEVHSATRGGVVEAGLVTSAEIMIAAEVRRSILRNTYNARVAQAEKGGLPSGIKLYGYLSVKGAAIEHPEHGPYLKRIFALAAHESFMAIEDLYNAEGVPRRNPYRTVRYLDDDGQQQTRREPTHWHHSTISQIVRNPAYYTGLLPWGRYRLPIPPLVSEDTWRAAQHHRTGPHARLDWPLSGHLRCGLCGARMSGWRYGNRYRCQRHRPLCSFSVHRGMTEARVEGAVAALLSDRAELSRLLTPHTAPQGVDQELARLEHESAEAFATWRRGIITPDELALVRRDLEGQRRDLIGSLEPPPPDEDLLSAVATLTPWQALADLRIVATVTKTDTVLRLE